MATFGTSNLTLLDHAKRLDPDGQVAAIVEILNQTNEALQDIPWLEANGDVQHRTTIRTGLPDSAWRKYNKGSQPTKSTTAQVDDVMGQLHQISQVDEDIAKLNGNSRDFMLSEATAHLEGMNQDFSSALFYANTQVDPEKFMGLAPRFNSLSAQNGGNIISGGGSGSDNCSIWLVGWSPMTCHGIFPKGSKAGIDRQDLGKQLITDSDGGKYTALVEQYKWNCGISVRDWRYVVRIANIDNSDLDPAASSGAKLIQLMIKAIHKIRNPGMVKLAFYANETVRTFLDLQTLSSSNMNVMYKDSPHGNAVLSFRGIPVRRCDALVATESTVS